jgi:hypothetical protein
VVNLKLRSQIVIGISRWVTNNALNRTLNDSLRCLLQSGNRPVRARGCHCSGKVTRETIVPGVLEVVSVVRVCGVGCQLSFLNRDCPLCLRKKVLSIPVQVRTRAAIPISRRRSVSHGLLHGRHRYVNVALPSIRAGWHDVRLARPRNHVVLHKSVHASGCSIRATYGCGMTRYAGLLSNLSVLGKRPIEHSAG